MVINKGEMSVLLNHSGKPVRIVPRASNGVLFQRANKMNLKLVNETSLLGQEILAKSRG